MVRKQKQAEALVMLRAGNSRKAVSVLLEMDVTTVRRIARENDVEPSNNHPKKVKPHRCPNGHLIKTEKCLQCEVNRLV